MLSKNTILIQGNGKQPTQTQRFSTTHILANGVILPLIHHLNIIHMKIGGIWRQMIQYKSTTHMKTNGKLHDQTQKLNIIPMKEADSMHLRGKVQNTTHIQIVGNTQSRTSNKANVTARIEMA